MDIIPFLESKLPTIADISIHILIAIIAFFVGKKLIHIVLKLLHNSFDRSKMEDGVANFLLSIIKFGLYFILIIILCQFLGLETSSVIALLGSAGLALGLALQGSLANFAGGVLILIMKPFVVGDFIIVDDKEGFVTSIDIIYTKLQMNDNKTVVLPNGKLADSNIINVTTQDKRRVDIEVGVDYSENIKKVRDILQDIIQNHDNILLDEPIDIVVGALNTSSVDMTVHVWVKKEDYWTVRWSLLEEIKNQFDEKGVVIPYNQLDVNIKNDGTTK